MEHDSRDRGHRGWWPVSDTETVFTVDDGAGLDSDLVPKLVSEAMTYLDALPFGKLLTGERLAAGLRRLYSTFRQFSLHPSLGAYRISAMYQARRHNLFGSRATIAAYREKHHE